MVKVGVFLLSVGTILVAGDSLADREALVSRFNADPRRTGLAYAGQGEEGRTLLVTVRPGGMTERKIRNVTENPIPEFHGWIQPVGFTRLGLTDGSQTRWWTITKDGFVPEAP
jgi:hypothetical protein